MSDKPLKRRNYNFSALNTLDVDKLFDPDNIPFSLLLRMVNLTVEEGEHSFIDTFRQLMPQVKDPGLLCSMRDFIYQEANHTRLHRYYSKPLPTAKTLDYASLQEAMDKLMSSPLGARQPASIQKKLHFVVLSELYAFRFFYYVIEQYHNRLMDLDAKLTYMYLLHGIEEMEHTSLAFDLYTHLYGSKPNHDSSNLQDYTAFNNVVMQALLTWTINACYHWQQQHPEFTFKVSAVKSMLVGESGVFPGGQICQDYSDPEFHPSDEKVEHWISAWDNDWNLLLQERLNNNIR